MSNSLGSPSLPFRADLQGLRALAVLLVFLAHAGLPLLAGGFVGVDVFFVLSGYLITGLLLREIEQRGRIDFLGFYARRMKRLLPAMLLMLGLVFLAASRLLSGAEARAQLASTPFAATWTSNFYYAFTQFGYFDELAARDLYIHTWSLAVEEQFYLIWPVLLLLLFRAGSTRRNIGGLLAIFLASLAASAYWTAHQPQFGFYMMPSRIWQFALGGLTHLALTQEGVRAGLRPRTAALALGAGGTLILGSAVALHPQLAYPGLWALLPSLGTALVIAGGQVLGTRNPLAHPALVWIGDRSYSIYLWHWPVLVLIFSLGFKDEGAVTFGLALLALLLAMLSYRWVELPFWKGRASPASALRTLLLALLVTTAALPAFLHGLRGLQLQETAEAAAPALSAQWHQDFPDIYRRSCDAWFHHARVEPCSFGPATAKKTVVLLGDSIGAQWFSMVQGVFTAPQWRLIVLTKSSCPMIDVDFFYERIGKNYQVCTDWRNAVLDEMARTRPDVLIMGSANASRFSEEEWVEGSARILGRLGQAVGTVIVLAGTPSLGFDGPGCAARQLSPAGTLDPLACPARHRMGDVEPITRHLETAAARFRNAHVLDLNDLVCPGGTCHAVNEQGLVVFRDSQHLTDTFVRSTIPVARARLERMVGDLRQP